MATPHTNSPKFSVLRLFSYSLLVVLAILIICEALGWPFLRQPAERVMAKQLERSVRIDAPFSLHLLGGIKLDVGGLWISAPNGFDAPHLIDAKNLSLQLRYRDLWKLKPEDAYRIKSIKVDGLDAHLIRHADGFSTWQFKQDESTPSRPFPILETLIVREGSAQVDDVISQTKLSLTFNTKEGVTSKAASSHVELKGKLRKYDLQGELDTDGFLPIASQNEASAPVSSKGWISYGGIHVSFDGQVSDLFGKQNVQGEFLAKGASLGLLGELVGVTLPTTDPFSLKADLTKTDQVWDANVKSAKVGESDLSGQFKYDPRPTRPILSGELKGKRFVLADLAPAFGTRNSDGSEAQPKSGKALPDRPLDLPSLNNMDADIKVSLDYVDLGNAFSKPISPLRADLKLDAGKLSLTNIFAHTADGSISGGMSVDAHQAAPAAGDAGVKPSSGPVPDWRIDLAWKDINLEKWLQVSKDRKDAAKQEGKDTPPAYVTGTLNGKTKLSGQGQSTAKLLGSLNGDVSLYIRKGSMSHLIVEVLGLDVAQALGVFIKGDQSLPLECAVMDLKADHGVVTPKVALIDTPVTLILIDGNLSLASEALDLRLAAKPKNFSPFTVRSPIHVTGTFSDPQASPEGGPIAARVLGGVALAFINPLAAILPFIDPGSGAQQASENACLKSLQQLEQHGRAAAKKPAK